MATRAACAALRQAARLRPAAALRGRAWAARLPPVPPQSLRLRWAASSSSPSEVAFDDGGSGDPSADDQAAAGKESTTAQGSKDSEEAAAGKESTTAQCSKDSKDKAPSYLEYEHRKELEKALGSAKEPLRGVAETERRFDKKARQESSFLPSWQNPSEWVDLEFARVGLGCGTSHGLELSSPWGSEEFPQPDMNVLWPHRTLTEHRRRPFTLPAGVEETTETRKQLEDNRTRLCQLWRLSQSHGISWDELDEAFVSFAKAGKSRSDEWKVPKEEESKMNKERQESATGQGSSAKEKKGVPPKGVPLAAKAKKDAHDRAVAYIKRFCPEGEEERYRSRTKRLAGRIYKLAKRRFFSPWRPGQLAFQLQQLVAARMARRETQERVFGLVPASGDQGGHRPGEGSGA